MSAVSGHNPPISLSALVCGLLMIYHRIQSPNTIIIHQAGARAAADSSLSAVSGDSWLGMTACVLDRDCSIFVSVVSALCNVSSGNTAANEGTVTRYHGDH